MSLTTRALGRTYLPHIGVFPLVLTAALAATIDPPRWRLCLCALLALPVLLYFAWRYSAWVAGAALDPWFTIRWLGAPVSAWWWLSTREPADEVDEVFGCGTAIAGLVLAALLGVLVFVLAAWLLRSPLFLALLLQGADLLLLALCLAQPGAFERCRAEDERRAALDSVWSYHAAHPELRPVYPAIRLEVELRTKIPAGTPPQAAWEAARGLILELMPLAQAQKHRWETLQARLRQLESAIAELGEDDHETEDPTGSGAGREREAALYRPG